MGQIRALITSLRCFPDQLPGKFAIGLPIQIETQSYNSTMVTHFLLKTILIDDGPQSLAIQAKFRVLLCLAIPCQGRHSIGYSHTPFL